MCLELGLPSDLMSIYDSLVRKLFHEYTHGLPHLVQYTLALNSFPLLEDDTKQIFVCSPPITLLETKNWVWQWYNSNVGQYASGPYIGTNPLCLNFRRKIINMSLYKISWMRIFIPRWLWTLLMCNSRTILWKNVLL